MTSLGTINPEIDKETREKKHENVHRRSIIETISSLCISVNAYGDSNINILDPIRRIVKKTMQRIAAINIPYNNRF